MKKLVASMMVFALVSLGAGVAAAENTAATDGSAQAGAMSSISGGSQAANDGAGASGSDAGSKQEQRTRRAGFYASVEGGVGYGSFTSDYEGMAFEMSGLGFMASILCGGMVDENLAIVGDLRIASLKEPTIRFGELSTTVDDSSAVLASVGPGIVYYVMPANLTVGASVLVSRASLEVGDATVGESNLGFGGSVRLGKEWAIRNGGVGLVGGLGVSSLKDGSSRMTATVLSISASFSYYK